MAITKQEKISIAKWYIHEWCFLGECQTIAKEATNLAVLEDIIKKDKSRHCCERCVHGNTGFCTKHLRSQGYYDCFRFKYGYWRRILIARGKYEDVLKTYC